MNIQKDPREVIIRPVISERSYDMMEQGKYTFEVAKDSNKIEIKNAIESDSVDVYHFVADFMSQNCQNDSIISFIELRNANRDNVVAALKCESSYILFCLAECAFGDILLQVHEVHHLSGCSVEIVVIVDIGNAVRVKLAIVAFRELFFQISHVT